MSSAVHLVIRPSLALALLTFVAVDAAAQEADVAPGDRIYLDTQVDRRATPVRGTLAPRYPRTLRSANVEGEVLVQFTVGPEGRAEMDSFKVLRSSHALFAHSVRQAVASMRFHPAEIGDRKVRQLVTQPFSFTLNRLPLLPRP
jgi:TonB family protein